MLHPAVEVCLFYRKVGIRRLQKGYPRIYAGYGKGSRVYVGRLLQKVYPRTYAVSCRRKRVYEVLNSKGNLWSSEQQWVCQNSSGTVPGGAAGTGSGGAA